MIRRPRRSTPATLTALSLLTACVLTALTAIQLLLERRPTLDYAGLVDAVHGTRWNDLPVAIGGGVMAVLGLILLLAALLPGRTTVLPLQDTEPSTATSAGVDRRGLRRTLRTAVNAVDGIASTKIGLRRGTARVRARTDRTTSAGLGDAVAAALEHRLDQIAPANRPHPKVRVTAARSPR